MQLKEARQAQHLSLEQAAHTTRIKLHYLQALESDDFEALPSRVQQRGFLRSYATLLHLPAEILLAQLDGDISVQNPDPAETQVDRPIRYQPVGEPGAGGFDAGSVSAASSGGANPNRLKSASQPNPILQELGAQLRVQRELLELSLEDIEQQTHLRMHYLAALENGLLENLPSPVQGRGMLNNYAVFLGMEPEPILLRYAEGLQADLKTKQEIQRQSVTQAGSTKRRSVSGVSESLPGPLRRFFSSDFWIGGLIVVFLVGFVAWASLRISQTQTGEEPTATAPSVADVLAPDTPTPTASLSVETVEGTLDATAQAETAEATPVLVLAESETTATDIPTPEFQAAESGKIQLYLVARQRAWARVTVDGSVELEGRVVPGSAYLFTADDRVELLTGNGAALQIFLNRQDLGPLGITGQVVQRIFTLSGMQTPTPAVPPTPTSTPTPAETETPSATGAATSAATSAATPTPTEIAP